MRKLFTPALLALALLASSGSPAVAEVEFDITLKHTGNAAAFTIQARSFCKKHLAIINARTGKPNPDFPIVPGAPQRIPYTLSDIDAVSPARIQAGVTLIFGVLFENTSKEWDLRVANDVAELTIITPVRDRTKTMTIPPNIDN